MQCPSRAVHRATGLETVPNSHSEVFQVFESCVASALLELRNLVNTPAALKARCQLLLQSGQLHRRDGVRKESTRSGQFEFDLDFRRVALQCGS